MAKTRSSASVKSAIESISKTLGSKDNQVTFSKMGEVGKDEALTKAPEYEYLRSGIHSLDMAVSKKGGFPMGTIVECYGQQGTGKTYTALQIAKAAQQAGKNVLFLDVEQAFNTDRAEEIGIVGDDSFIIANSFRYGEQVWNTVHSAQESGYFDVIIVDSVGALFSKRELDIALDDEPVMMARAKMNKRAMAKCVSLIDPDPAKGKNPLIVLINHVIATGEMYGASQTTPGGDGIKYYSHIRMEIVARRKKECQIYNEDGEHIGTKALCKVWKTRMNRPGQDAEIPIYFERRDDSDLWAKFTELAAENEQMRLFRNKYVYPWSFSKKAQDDGEEGIIAETVEDLQDQLMANDNYFLIQICKACGVPDAEEHAQAIAAYIVASREKPENADDDAAYVDEDEEGGEE